MPAGFPLALALLAQSAGAAVESVSVMCGKKAIAELPLKKG